MQLCFANMIAFIQLLKSNQKQLALLHFEDTPKTSSTRHACNNAQNSSITPQLPSTKTPLTTRNALQQLPLVVQPPFLLTIPLQIPRRLVRPALDFFQPAHLLHPSPLV